MESKIKNLKQVGGQYQWDVEDAFGEVKSYRTNQHGEGIWLRESNGDTQIVGNTQFQPSDKISSARRQIQRFFNR